MSKAPTARKEKKFVSLEQAFLSLCKEEEVGAFLKDLCTPAEVKAMTERWKVCQLLKEEKMSYQDIHTSTGVSITTVGRVARFLFNEPYHGYTAALHRLHSEVRNKHSK